MFFDLWLFSHVFFVFGNFLLAIEYFLFAWSGSLLTISQFLFLTEDSRVTCILLLELIPVLPFPMDWSSIPGIFLLYQKSLTWRLVVFRLHKCLCITALRFEPISLNPRHKCIRSEPAFFLQPAYSVLTVQALSFMELCYRVRISGTISVDWHSPLAHQFLCHRF